MAIVAAITMPAACGTGSADEAREKAPPPSPIAASAATAAEPTTFFSDRPLDLLSPDGRYRLVSTSSADGLPQLTAIRVSDGERQVVGSYEPPTAVLWSPSSETFFVNDQRGSGQSSYVEVVRLEQGRFRRDVSARRNLNRLYNGLFECDLSDDFINTWGQNWLGPSTLVVQVQASHHSGGCPLDPLAANQLLLLVNTRSGEVLHQRAVRPERTSAFHPLRTLACGRMIGT
jgi:hypothetical protein